jgi:hypothetical protein
LSPARGIVLKSDGRSLLRLDHTGKDPGKGQRGTSAKDGDVDVMFQFSDVDAHGFMTLRT